MYLGLCALGSLAPIKTPVAAPTGIPFIPIKMTATIQDLIAAVYGPTYALKFFKSEPCRISRRLDGRTIGLIGDDARYARTRCADADKATGADRLSTRRHCFPVKIDVKYTYVLRAGSAFRRDGIDREDFELELAEGRCDVFSRL